MKLTEVWCSKCDRPAVIERTVSPDRGTTTYKAAYCGSHNWAFENTSKRKGTR